MTSYVNVLMQATKSKRKECNLCQDRDNYLQFQNIYEWSSNLLADIDSDRDFDFNS